MTAVTVNVAGSESLDEPGSVAVKVIVSAPFQSAFGIVIVAIRLPSMLTVRCGVARIRPGHLRIRVVRIGDIII